MINAREALSSSKRHACGNTKTADELNFSLTINRIMTSIKAATERGEKNMVYVVPWIVIDGTTTEQGLLARQLEKRLKELGYLVERRGDRLFIDWDLELMEEEKRLRELAKKRAKKAPIQEQVNMSEMEAQFGTRNARRINDVLPPPPLPWVKANRVQNEINAKLNGGQNKVTIKRKKRK